MRNKKTHNARYTYPNTPAALPHVQGVYTDETLSTLHSTASHAPSDQGGTHVEATPTNALSLESASPNHTATKTAPEASVGSTPRRLYVVVSRYLLEHNNAIIQVVIETHAGRVVPETIVLTQGEAAQLAQLQDHGPHTTYAVLQYLERLDIPSHKTRRHLLLALEELQRILRLMEQEFPTSGLHAWSVGTKLHALHEQLLLWVFAFHQRCWSGSTDDQEFLAQTLCAKDGFLDPAFAHYPQQLASFLARHKLLASLLPQAYGDNDLEVEQLIRPLQDAIKRCKRYVKAQYTTVAERKQQRQRLSLTIIVVLAVLVGGGWWLYKKFNGPYLAAATNFKKGKLDGVEAVYYKGRDFKKYLGRRNYRKLDLRWVRRPDPVLPANHFSVRVKGHLEAPQKGSYNICLRFDDGGRMELNGQRVLNDWRGGAARTRCKTMRLAKGWHPFAIEMFESTGPAELRLLWAPPGAKRVDAVPPWRLCCRNPKVGREAKQARRRPSQRRETKKRKATKRRTPVRRRPANKAAGTKKKAALLPKAQIGRRNPQPPAPRAPVRIIRTLRRAPSLPPGFRTKPFVPKRQVRGEALRAKLIAPSKKKPTQAKAPTPKK